MSLDGFVFVIRVHELKFFLVCNERHWIPAFAGIQCRSFTEGYSITSRPNKQLTNKPAPIPSPPSGKGQSRRLITHPIRRFKKRLQQHVLLLFIQTQILHRHQHAGQPLIAR